MAKELTDDELRHCRQKNCGGGIIRTTGFQLPGKEDENIEVWVCTKCFRCFTTKNFVEISKG